MSIWNFLLGDAGVFPLDTLDSHCQDTGCTINPATGLPMVGDGCGGVDIGGSPFGFDVHSQHDSCSPTTTGWGNDIWDDSNL